MGRSKAEIILAVETRLAAYIVGEKHPDACRCAPCWVRFQAEWAKRQDIEPEYREPEIIEIVRWT